MENKPLVSVLMTAYNREKYIAEAIESVLASSYTNFELIIVDDKSTDKSVQIARRYEATDSRIKVHINEKNLGQFPNRNKAAQYAKGKYIKYLDSDDMLYFFSLELLVRACEKYHDVGIGVAFLGNKPAEKKFPFFLTSEQAFTYFFLNDTILSVGPSGTIFNKQKFVEIGKYIGNHATADTTLMLKLAMQTNVVVVQPGFLYYRIHASQVLNNKNKVFIYTKENFINSISALTNKNIPLNNDIKSKAIYRLYKKTLKIILVLIFKNARIKEGLILLKFILRPQIYKYF